MNMDQSLVLDLIFIALMIVPLAPGAVWYRNRVLRGESPEKRERILSALYRDTRRMWLAWCIALGLLTGWLAVDQFSEGGVRTMLPVNMAVLIGFHVLFWPFVAPVIRRLERLVNEDNSGASSAIRTATLKPRRLGDYMPSHWKVVAAIVALSGLFVAAAALLQIGDIETRLVVMAFVFTAVGLFELLLWGFVMRMEVAGAAPHGGLTQAAAEELRRFRVSGFFWMLVATSVVFFACALGCVEVGRGTIPEPNLGIVGGIAGTLVGFAGAGFGIAASLKANRLRQESNAAKS